MPNVCAAESASVSNLIREKQRKMAELEKCMGTSKGLKIAGISTLGVTAAGVAANVVEAKKIKDYDDKIELADKKIETAKDELAKIEQCKAQNQVYKDGKCTTDSNFAEKADNTTVRIFSFAADDNLLCEINNLDKDKITNQSKSQTCNGINKGGFEIKSGDYLVQGTSGCFSSMTYPADSVDSGSFCWCKITASNASELATHDFKFTHDFSDKQLCLKGCAKVCFAQEVITAYNNANQ